MTETATPLVTEETATPATTQPLEVERIRVRAYELYEKRNGGSGDAQSDWYRAEIEIRGLPAEAAK